MEIIDRKQLLERALVARKKAYAPYSGFSVGAALLCDDGKIFEGCNIESASFTPTCCAERVAIFKAISELGSDVAIKAIAVVGGKDAATEPCLPCGVCRQVMSEFMPPDAEVILANGENTVTYKLKELLPYAFNLKEGADNNG